MDETADQLATALDQHRAGRLDDAEAAYREILATSPRHADALHLLGMLAHARGAQGQAIGLIGRAILVEPGAAEFHSNIAAVYLSMGQSEEAIAHARRAVALCPFILKPTTISEMRCLPPVPSTKRSIVSIRRENWIRQIRRPRPITFLR